VTQPIPHRGLEELIDAVPHLERGVLVLMGWGVMEERLSQLVAARGLEDRVRMTGPVAQDELLHYTVDADVGVIPYQAVGLNNYYTTPNKLFEYMAAGVPVAGSRFPELIRFVEGLGIGRTFDPRDPQDIAAAINGVLGDEAAHTAMRERARAAATRLTWEEQVAPLLSIYGSNGAHRRLV
jgi:glycosyltransferase involved in cell wall biosynthesis